MVDLLVYGEFERVKMRVNLGCGNRKMSGWINLDSSLDVNPDICGDLEDGFIFESNSVDVFNARAILEHVELDKFIFVMSEIHRCLKPGGLVYIMVPHWNQFWHWSDPTHKVAWDRRMMDWFINKGNRASGLGIDFYFEELFYNPILHRGVKEIVNKLEISLEEAKIYLSNIIDSHCWWLRKPVRDGEVGINLNVPIYQGGLIISQVRQARQDYLRLVEILEQTRRETNVAVRISYNNVISGISAIKAGRQAVISAKLF